MCAKITTKTNLMTDGGDDFPGLTTFYRLHKIIGFGIEKDEMIFIVGDFRIYYKILFYDFLDTIIDDDLLSFPPLLLSDPRSSTDPLMVIQELLISQRYQV